MARRTMVERKRRAADRDTRRESLLVLLSRVQRGVPITAAEASLLRAHVEVEITESTELRRTVQGQQNEIQRQGRQLDAAHDAIREAEQQAADYAEQLHMYRTVAVQHRAQAAAQLLAAERTAADQARAAQCHAEQRPNYDLCPCNGVCHECDDSPCDACQPVTTSTPEPQP